MGKFISLNDFSMMRSYLFGIIVGHDVMMDSLRIEMANPEDNWKLLDSISIYIRSLIRLMIFSVIFDSSESLDRSFNSSSMISVKIEKYVRSCLPREL